MMIGIGIPRSQNRIGRIVPLLCRVNWIDAGRLGRESRGLCAVAAAPAFFRKIHQTTQRVAAAGQARAHSTDRDAQDLCGCLVRHAFETDEQDDFALVAGETGECALEFAQLARGRRIRRGNERRRHLLDVDRCFFAHRAPDHVDVLIVHDGEKPGPDVGTCLP